MCYFDIYFIVFFFDCVYFRMFLIFWIINFKIIMWNNVVVGSDVSENKW